MLLTPPATARGGHVGYVAGRYRDGAYSDMWTDVRRCARLTFTAYAPACSCGWRGAPIPVGDTGLIACHREWNRIHLAAQLITAAAPAESGDGGPDAR
jgi:hypothetical protein